mmetsp:Transcript_18741/g.53734  ORF Transcript_18741/g.53734 Transcript_18741/m.53734 type:complete len:358 (+) Transcript_18741:177-1250(+)
MPKAGSKKPASGRSQPYCKGGKTKKAKQKATDQVQLTIQRQNAAEREAVLGNGRMAKLQAMTPDYSEAAFKNNLTVAQHPSIIPAHKSRDRYEVSEEFLQGCGNTFKQFRAFAVDRVADGCDRMDVARAAQRLAVRLFDHYEHKLWQQRKDETDLLVRNPMAVGFACLLIASKYEEKVPVPVAQLVDLINEVLASGMRDRTYTAVDLLNLEIHILMTVGMELPDSTVVTFADRFAKAGGIPPDTKDHAFVQFLQELALTDYTFSQYKSNIISAAAVYMTRKMWLLREGQPRHGEPSWTEALKRVTGLQKSQLMPCYKEMSRLLRSLNRPHIAIGKQDACIAKWSTPANYNIASVFYD